jgi:hypothetical protein
VAQHFLVRPSSLCFVPGQNRLHSWCVSKGRAAVIQKQVCRPFAPDPNDMTIDLRTKASSSRSSIHLLPHMGWAGSAPCPNSSAAKHQMPSDCPSRALLSLSSRPLPEGPSLRDQIRLRAPCPFQRQELGSTLRRAPSTEPRQS